MKCDTCKRLFTYCFYINDEHWLKATDGVKEGHLCAHCILEELGGLDWYLVFNEPQERGMQYQRDADAKGERQ